MIIISSFFYEENMQCSLKAVFSTVSRLGNESPTLMLLCKIAHSHELLDVKNTQSFSAFGHYDIKI